MMNKKGFDIASLLGVLAFLLFFMGLFVMFSITYDVYIDEREMCENKCFNLGYREFDYEDGFLFSEPHCYCLDEYGRIMEELR